MTGKMINYVLEYMASRGVHAFSPEEQELLETGIARYLYENGTDKNETGEFYRKYVNENLNMISTADMKAYFIHYPSISEVHQIAIEFDIDGTLPESRKKDLYRALTDLYDCGLGEKYTPEIVLKSIPDSPA